MLTINDGFLQRHKSQVMFVSRLLTPVPWTHTMLSGMDDNHWCVPGSSGNMRGSSPETYHYKYASEQQFNDMCLHHGQ